MVKLIVAATVLPLVIMLFAVTSIVAVPLQAAVVRLEGLIAKTLDWM